MLDPARRESPGRRPRIGAFVWAMLVILIAAIPGGAGAQTLSTGVIVGAVLDDRGDPLNAVTITITNRTNGQRMIVRTDRAGRFGSELLSPGTYDALFERLGFRPHRLEGITVVAGASRDVAVSLEILTQDMRTPSVSVAPGMQSFAGSSGPDRWILDQPAAAMPLEGRGLSALLSTSSSAGLRHEVEGLPATHTTVVIDGLPFARRARGFDVLALDLAVPVWSLAQTGLVTNNPDVEYPGAAASLSGHTRRGGRNRGITAFGDFGSDATASGTGTPPSFTSYRAGGLALGPIVGDTASFVVGGEILRSRSAYDAFWVDDPLTTALAETASNRFDADLGGFTQPALESIDRESAFGRLDTRLSESTSLNAFGIYSTINEPQPVAPWTERALGSTITPRIRSILSALSLITRIDDDMMSQVDVGFESNRSTSAPRGNRDPALPRTTIVDAGRQFGSDRSTQYAGELTAFYLRGTLHFRSGTHWRKLGLVAELPSYKVPTDVGRAGSFTFASVDDFRDGFGFFRGIEGSTRNRAEFSTRRISVIGQDVWRPSPSIEMTVGARVTSFRLPDSSDVSPSAGWLNLAGQSNRAFVGRIVEFEPRFAITVNPAGRPELALRGGIMVDGNAADPAVIGEIFGNNGTLTVRSGLGQVADWPSVPISTGIALRNQTLSVIGPDFRGPRTTRTFGSVSRALGAGGVTVGVTYRKTEFLPQRVDLNLLPGVAAVDQHGRPIFGQLRKTGSMLTPEYGTNRRFGNFEEVWGLQATGESRYTGITIIAERPISGSVGFFGSYTWSKTEDDWLIGNAGDPFSQLAPFPDSLAPADWTTGRSDLDVPHRVVAGLELTLPGSFTPKLATLLRFQSGYPFTPGFRQGVDVNGDGSGSNDPAFIDESISGLTDLYSEWPCLQDDAGTFIRRNACRGPDIAGLDARFSVTFQRASEYTAAIVVDGLNLIASDAGEVDRALYLIDRSAPLDFQPNGRVEIPLVINPDFGKLLSRYTAQRQLRVGVRVSF